MILKPKSEFKEMHKNMEKLDLELELNLYKKKYCYS